MKEHTNNKYMKYNFINIAFFIGLLGGGIPWGSLLNSKIATHFQLVCLLIALGNLLYGLYIVFK